MSEIKSNKISPRKGTTTTIGDSGDSVTISSGTITTNAGTISTAGITGGTINNTTGTITGLQQQVSWQTGSIKQLALRLQLMKDIFKYYIWTNYSHTTRITICWRCGRCKRLCRYI